MKIKFKTKVLGCLLILSSLSCSKDPATTTIAPTPVVTNQAYIPDGWKALSKFMGNARSNAVSFVINNKIYVGLGYSNSIGFSEVSNDFFEFDPLADKWKAIASFPSTARANAISFVIKNKAYVGLGTNYNRVGRSALYEDIFEYDPTTDKWIKKADFPGRRRDQPVSFTIAEKGYFGTGNVDPFSPINTNEFWQYDPASDKWTQKASFVSSARCRAFGFSIGQKGYIGGGENNASAKINDFYEYDPATDLWTKKMDFPINLSRAVGANINELGYVFGGIKGEALGENLYYKYDSKANTWTQAGDMAAVKDNLKGRFYSSVLPLNGKAYIGLGSRFLEGENLSDFYEVVLK